MSESELLLVLFLVGALIVALTLIVAVGIFRQRLYEDLKTKAEVLSKEEEYWRRKYSWLEDMENKDER